LVDLIGGDVGEFAAVLPSPLRRALDVVLQRADPTEDRADALGVNLAVLELLEALTDRQRLLLILDDVQWLDPPTRGVLGFAIRRLAGRQLAVVAAVRGTDGTSVEWLLPEPRAIVTVGPMTEAEIAHVVALRTGRMPTPGRAARLHRLSGGNPYLAVEVARAASDLPSGVEDLPVPQRYRPVLAARLSGLSSAARRTVLAAALLSRPTPQTLTRIGGQDGLPDAEAASVLKRTGKLVEFDHPLLAAVSREEAEPATIRSMHAELASVVRDAVECARHLALSTPSADGQVAAEVEAAADIAAGRAAIATAAELARHAFTLTPDAALEDRVRRAVSAARWLDQIGESAAAKELLGPLIAALPIGPQRARCLTTLAGSIGQEIAGTIQLFGEALAQPGLQPSDEIEIHIELSNMHILRGDLAEARKEAALAEANARAAGHAGLAARAALYEAVIEVFSGIPPTESSAWALVQAHSWDSAPVYDHPDMVLAWEASYTHEDQARAVELLEGLAGRARVFNDLPYEGWVALLRAEAEIRRGELATADTLANKGYRILSDGVRDQFPLYVRAHVAAWRGDLATARDLAGEGLRMARETGDVIFEAQNLLVLGFTELAAGRYKAACGHETAVRDLMDRMRWGHPGVFRWQGDAVEAFLGVGRVDEAGEVASELWRQADRLDLRGCRALAARCDGLIHAHRGDLQQAQDSLSQSLRLMDGLDMPLERGRSLLALGVARRRGRQRATARAALTEAREIFTEAGATVWARRVDEEIARTVGARGRPSLTVGERAVADLAAAGATNREIGAQLFLSPKTVEAVLTRVYRKLGVRSRTELARQLQPERRG
jgi:DNA-binding CsgD family transcriptional regulator